MIDLITVVFHAELPLLQIQARSMDQYIDSTDIDTITIVVNDEDSVGDQIDPTWWGKHSNKVKVKCYSRWNYTSRITGWENQQICKLMASSESTAEWSMVLDAKTWFIKSFNHADFFDEHGCARSGYVPTMQVFDSSREFVEKLYNIKLDRVIGPGGVPFIFHTDTVKNLVESIDNFIEFFQVHVRYPTLVTEFHLYSGFVLFQYGSYEELYNSQAGYSVVNVADWEANIFDQLFNHMQTDKNLLTVSIHRRTYQHLTQEQLLTWVLFLEEHKLICHIPNTLNLLNTYIK